MIEQTRLHRLRMAGGMYNVCREMNHMKKFFSKVALFVIGLSLAGVAQAATVRTVNLVEMVELAGRVFRGRCVSAQQVVHESLGLPVMEYTFMVEDGIKGVADGQTIKFRQALLGADIPLYRPGQELMLFLHPESKIGLTSPVGMGQGMFRVSKSGPGDVTVLNALGNRNLAYNLSAQQLQSPGLSAGQMERLRNSSAIPLSDFRDMVAKISNWSDSRGKGTTQ